MPFVPTTPWPPPEPEDFGSANDRDDAARIIFATSTIIVTPCDRAQRIEELVRDIPERQTIFWVPRERYASLVADISEVRTHVRPGREVRLDDIAGGELGTFLREDLPRAGALSDYDREILCLPRRR